MKVFLAFIVGAAVVYFLLRGQPTIERASDDATPAPNSTSIPAATKAPTAAPPTTTYKALLQPAYLALIESTEKATDIKEMNQEAAALHALLSSAPPTPERDAALRLCVTVDRAATLTRSMADRAYRPSPRSKPSLTSGVDLERAERDAESKDAFFQKAVETQWRAQIAPLQTAARAEWARIPDGAVFSSAGLSAYTAARNLRQRIAAAESVYFSVVQVVPNGVLARPFEEYAIASSSARLGMGGPVGSGYRPGSKTIFIQGFPNATEGADATVMAYRDGSYSYTDTRNASRTVEKWIFVRSVKP
jgi:hypothetical protein